MQIFTPKRRKKKPQRIKKFKDARECPLCNKQSQTLIMNKFCLCIANESDFFFNNQLKARMVIPESKIRLLVQYNKLLDSRLKDIINKEPEIKKTKSIRRENPQDSFSPTKKAKQKFYDSWEWKKLRLYILDTQGRECLSCGAKKELCVDHIKSLHYHWDLRLDASNLQVLCNDCNMGKGATERDFRAKND